MPWSAIASIAGGLLGSDSASDAAAGQAQATREANELQRYIYDSNVKLNQPAIDAGNLGRNNLLQMLGLGGTPGGAPAQSRDQLRQSLLAKYTTPGAMTPTYEGGLVSEEIGHWANGVPILTGFTSGAPTIDETGLQAAIDAEMARGGIDSQSGDYGSLMKAFTGDDLQNEPGYQFGLQQGNQALDRKAAAGGGYFSGAALKAAQRFGQDYAGTKFGEAFNRDTANKTNTFNRLTGLINPGQTAANQVGTMGASYANQVGNNLTSNATAQGAAGIAGANAWQNAINGGVNAYQQYNTGNSLLKNLNRYGTTGGFDTMGYGGEY